MSAEPHTPSTPGLRHIARVRPRWHKVFSDLWSNKVRTLLVVASIAVGLFAVGMIATIYVILSEDIRAGYALMNPTNIQVYADAFDDDMVETVRSVDGVEYAEGQRSFDLAIRTRPDAWSRIDVHALPEGEVNQINVVTVDQGQWPPPEREIVIERNKLGNVYFPQPGVVEVKLPSGKIRQMRLAGVVHDQTVGIASTGGGFFTAPIQGYISAGSLEWLEQPDGYNLLYVTVLTDRDNEQHLRAIANQVSDAMENNGGLVYNSAVRGTRDHPTATYVDAMVGVLFVLGALVVFLSGFLITNTLSALLNQQSQQIAIMKTVGARSRQVTLMYVALIAVYGLIALAIALPLSNQAAFGLLRYLTVQINFVVLSYRSVALSVILQVAIAMLVPQVAGIAPILRGARLKVQDALSGAVAEADPAHAGWLDRQIAGASTKGFGRRISRPLLISLRNTFRHKVRLIITLFTLSLGGAIFIGTFNVRASLENHILRMGRYFIADVNLTMDGPYRISRIERELQNVPGVQRVEGWAFARTELLLENGQAGEAAQLLGPPVSSTLIQPILIKGRWIQPADTNAIVLSERFIARYPDLDVGQTLRLRVNGDESEWVVVGFFQLAGKSAGYVAYTGYDYLSEIIHQPFQAVTFRVTADRPNLTLDEQKALASRIEDSLQQRGYDVSEVQAGQSLITNSASGLNTLTTFLLIMAILIAIVGSIGLMGTMSMNVMDRTREIGVMRAIGASDRAVMNMVLVEGLLIGLLSWVIGTLLAVPISKLLSDTIHLAVFQSLAQFTFTPTGPLYWLALVVVLSVLASVIPARSAARLTIREALAYE
jgi:putative ABC transport system permease protein